MDAGTGNMATARARDRGVDLDRHRMVHPIRACPMKLGLARRIVLIFVVLAAAMVAAVGALSYRSARESLKAAIISDMLAVALEKEAVLDAWLVQRLSDLGRLGTEADVVHDTADLIAAAPATRGAHAAHQELVRELAFRIVGPRSGFVELAIIDAKSATV